MTDNSTLNPGTGGDVIAADDIASGVASGAKVQRIKNGFGADGTYSDVAPDNGLPVAGGYKEFSGSAGANNTDLITQDVSAYRWVALQFTGTWTATATFQCSMDGTNWVNCYLSQVTLGATSWVSIAQATGIFVGPVQARYFRVRTTAYTSGTVAVVAGFTALPGTPSRQALDGMSVTVVGNNTYANSDSVAPGTGVLGVSALASVYNGTNWERTRSFGTQGAVGVTPTPGTTGGWAVSSQTALTNTKTQVKASAGTVGGYIIHNPNTSAIWIQVWDVANGSITVGTTSPTWTIPIPAGSTANVEFTCGINHATAINVAATTTATGSTAPTTAATATILYK